MIENKAYWWPVATEKEFARGKPLARMLHGMPLVIFANQQGKVSVLQDRCPHRHAALSAGCVKNGEVECPYHGWLFDTNGKCTKVPGMQLESSQTPIVKTFSGFVRHGLVWVCLAANETTIEPVPPSVETATDSFFMTDTVACTIQQAAENFLDGFHTHFVHAGWIRRDNQRQNVRVNVHHLENGIEARYSEEGLQSGLISSLLEGDRQISMGRFRLPGIAEIEYRGRHGLNLLITAWLTPENENRIRFHARIATRKGILPGWLKQLFLYQLFGIILRQDKRILEQTSKNIQQFSEAGLDTQVLDSELDFLGPSIRQLLAGEELKIQDGWEKLCQL